MNLYQEQLLEHWQNPRNFKKVKNPNFWAELNNPLCGDMIRLDLKVVGGKIIEVGFSGSGCLISQATASLLTEEIKKTKILKKIKEIDEKKFFKILGIEISGARRKCALLALEVLRKALK